ncbi:MAG TPA: hypothetical protein PLH52_01870 [Paludibacteraceae bacterium]|jgi:hypothetical protein|nr:hypothetical protein [Paludibacteraceae bacterium]
MKKLNQFLFKRRSAAHFAATDRNRRFVNYENANTVLLLFESDYIEKNRYIRKVIEQLAADGKKVTAWGYLYNKKATTANLPSFKIMDKSTVDWFECPKDQLLKELREETYDLLIDLTLTDHLPLQYICLYANAAFKTGMSRNIDNILDFKINIPLPENTETVSETTEDNKSDFEDLNESMFHTDQQFLYELIIFYLKNIQTTD